VNILERDGAKAEEAMKMRMAKQWWLPGLLALALMGCATYPVAKNLRDQARPVTLSQVLENPGAVQGTVVIWGGRIIQTVNHTNGADIYVLKLPLDSYGEPLARANSPGRFIARGRGFLDPEVYRRGRLITVAGTVAGVETQAVQHVQYTYPTVTVKQLHLWPPQRRYYYYYPAWGYYYPYYPDWYWTAPSPWGWGIGWYYGGGDWDEGGWHHRR
jgi:outer membrane lipoprotein